MSVGEGQSWAMQYCRLTAHILHSSTALRGRRSRAGERMTDGAEMEVGSSNNFPLRFIITATTSLVALTEGQESHLDSK